MLGHKNEGIEQFCYYLHQNVCQDRRGWDSGVNTKSAEEVLEGREQLDKRVVASTTIFHRLPNLDVRETCNWD
jgi:hypothetical protein